MAFTTPDQSFAVITYGVPLWPRIPDGAIDVNDSPPLLGLYAYGASGEPTTEEIAGALGTRRRMALDDEEF